MTLPPGRSSGARLLTNGAWNALSAAVAGGIAFLVVPLLLRQLGEAAYGVWVLIGSVFAYSVILHLGLSSAINRHIPVALARGREDDVRRVVSTGTVFFAGVGGLVALATLVLWAGLPRWFNVPAVLVPEAREAVLVAGGLLAVTVVSQTFGAALSGYQRYDLPAMARILMLSVRGIAVWGLVRGDAGVVRVAWIFGLTELGVNLLQVAFGMRLMPARIVAVRWFDQELLRDMLAYGGNTFLYSTGAVIAYKASEAVIGALGRTEQVARYSVAAAGVLTLSAVVESMTAAIKPAVSALDAREEQSAIRDLSLVTQRLSLLIILPSTTFLVLMGGAFLRLWTGLAEHEVAVAMAFVAVGQAFRLAQQSNFLVLVGKGEHRFFGQAVLGVGLSTIFFTALAVGPLGLGVVGAGAASCLSWGVVAGVIIPAHVNARLGISGGERWRAVLLPAALGCAPALALLGAWTVWRPPATWLEVALVVLTTAAVTVLGAWRFALAPRERERFGAAVARRLGRAR